MKFFRTGVGLLVSTLAVQTAGAITTRGLIGHWDMKPDPPMKVVLDAGTTFTGNLWNSSFNTTTDGTTGETVWTQTSPKSPFSSQYIRIDPSKTYRLSGRFRSTGSVDSRLYFGMSTYDENKIYISSTNSNRKSGANEGVILN